MSLRGRLHLGWAAATALAALGLTTPSALPAPGPEETIVAAAPDLLARLISEQGLDEIVFAARQQGEDPHWYANFGATLDASN